MFLYRLALLLVMPLSLSAYPMGYYELYRPDDGRRIYVVGDVHIPSVTRRASEQGFFEALDKFDRESFEKFAVICEASAENVHASDGDLFLHNVPKKLLKERPEKARAILFERRLPVEKVIRHSSHFIEV